MISLPLLIQKPVESLSEAEAEKALKYFATEIARHDQLYYQQSKPEIEDSAYDLLRQQNAADGWPGRSAALRLPRSHLGSVPGVPGERVVRAACAAVRRAGPGARCKVVAAAELAGNECGG